MIVVDSEPRKQYALKVIGALSLDAPGWDVEITRHVEHRTTQQNARLWALHTLAGKELGYSPEEMHEYALCRHFGYVEKVIGGVRRTIPLKRSSARDKKEFAEFMEATETWYISDFGVFLGND